MRERAEEKSAICWRNPERAECEKTGGECGLLAITHITLRQFLLEQLDDRRMAKSSGEPPVARNQWSPELFGKPNVGGVIGGKIVAELPNSGQQHEMRVPCKPEIQ